jgi:serine phosphatase RsbU (regulator of sigma subunit)/uncharacterized glyoxalase superfamily protein PhnB
MSRSNSHDWTEDSGPRLDRQSPYLRLHHAAIFVSDHDRSLGFYVDQLGFNVVADHRFGEQGRFILVAPPDGTTLLALISPQPNSEQYRFIGRSGLPVFVTEDINAQFNTWLARGVRFRHAPQVAAWGGTFTQFEDLDGNSFALVGWDELSREVEARRRAVAERTEAERRLAQELEFAKQVQARLFPQVTPPLKTLDYAGLCLQARKVGGDYYDFLTLGPERLGLVIGDISGKGMAAALLMANLQANLRSQYASASAEPEQFLQSVNRLFFENTIDSAYATLVFAEYDGNTRCLRYANCGHLSPLVFRRDGNVDRLDSTTTVLGLFSEWECVFDRCQLFAGDTLMLYTDGVTESFSESGEEFGEERLIEAFWAHHQLPPAKLLSALVQEFRNFNSVEQQDDVTLIVARCV